MVLFCQFQCNVATHWFQICVRHAAAHRQKTIYYISVSHREIYRHYRVYKICKSIFLFGRIKAIKTKATAVATNEGSIFSSMENGAGKTFRGETRNERKTKMREKFPDGSKIQLTNCIR